MDSRRDGCATTDNGLDPLIVAIHGYSRPRLLPGRRAGFQRAGRVKRWRVVRAEDAPSRQRMQDGAGGMQQLLRENSALAIRRARRR